MDVCNGKNTRTANLLRFAAFLQHQLIHCLLTSFFMVDANMHHLLLHICSNTIEKQTMTAITIQSFCHCDVIAIQCFESS